MALPPGFETPSEYFEECLTFFKSYQYLYNFANTDILVNNVLDKIEVNDLNNLNVFVDKFNLAAQKCDHLTDFFQNLNKLKIEYEDFEKRDLEFLIDVPISQKKKHEIANLANEIQVLCKDIECGTVVDFGSGLGYLDQQIYKIAGYNVLGLECSETNYVGAKKRQRKYHSDSLDHVKYVKHRITENSFINIDEYIEDKFININNICIAGLHACADLTIDAINIFLKMKKVRALIIMPCCYHRMIEEDGGFKNFPLSTALREIYDKYNGVDFLKVPFLRLATQPPNAGNEKMEDLVFNLLARAVMQLYSYKHNCRLKRNKRKAVRLKSIGNNFENYIENAITGFKLLSNNDTENTDSEIFNKEELLMIWREISQLTFKKAAIFMLLQNCLQPVFENFVLYDRLFYLQENGIKNCLFKKIVDDNISPRCLALIAQK